MLEVRQLLLLSPEGSCDMNLLKDKLELVNALFYYDYNKQNDDLVWKLQSLKIPLVTCNYRGNLKVAKVYEDWDWAMREIMSHLIDLGHERIALATFPFDDTPYFTWAKEREEAFLQMAKLEGLSIDEKDIYRSDAIIKKSQDYFKSGKEIGEKLFQSFQDYTAVIAVNDTLATGLIEASQQYNLKIPEDFSLAGFDNNPESIVLGLTTIQHASKEDGMVAAEMLLDLYLQRNNNNNIMHVVNRPKLIIRNTTAGRLL